MKPLLAAALTAAVCLSPAGLADETIHEGSLTDTDGRIEEFGESKIADTYTVTVAEGESLVVDLQSNVFDTYLYVNGPNGESLSNDDHEGTNSRVEVQRATAGEWTIQASHFGSEAQGDYTLTIVTEEAPNLVEILSERGELTETDRLSYNGKYVDPYELNLPANTRIFVNLHGNNLDTFVSVVGPDGFIGSNDDHGGSTDSYLEFRTLDAGVYTVYATSYGNHTTGAYQLIVEQAE